MNEMTRADDKNEIEEMDETEQVDQLRVTSFLGLRKKGKITP